MQDKHIVVVHYSEDRDILINKLKDTKYSYTVYHKGNDPQPEDIFVKNYGTGNWIIFKHIVDNYDNLPEYLIFTQANPDDHVVDFLTAIESKFTSGYGSLCYARSFHTQYREEADEFYPTKLLLDEIGIKFFNDTNTTKFLYPCQPGAIFYVSGERIKQRPKEFYQKIVDLELDDYLYLNNLMIYTEHPQYFYDNLYNLKEEYKALDKKKLILKIIKRVGKKDDYFCGTVEPLYWYIFADFEMLKMLQKSEMVLNNKLYFDTNESEYTGKTFNFYPFNSDLNKQSLNFKLMENDWFDWNCPYYLKWREKLIEKTINVGKEKGFEAEKLLEFYENIGYKHISL